MSSQRSRPVILQVVLAAVALTLTSCGDQSEPSAAVAVVESKVSRTEVAAASSPADATVVRHVGSGLYAWFSQEAGDGNLAYSPASITIALGMTRAGAEGLSARQLDAFLGTKDPAALHAALNGLDTTLRARSVKRDEGEITVSLANSLWGQAGVTWQAPFLDTLKRDYGVGMHVLDYGDPEPARKAINAWVAGETHDKITDLLAKGTIKESTRLALVNALYLSAPWAKRFDKAGERAFTTAAGSKVQATMMKKSEVRRYQRGDGWQAVTVPYIGGELAMTLLVPDAGKLATVEGALDDSFLQQILTGTEEREVVLTMPRFDLASRPSLGDALKAAGVTEPFLTGTNFRPMTTDDRAQPLQLAEAVHMATVTVDEKGTVASAATAMIFDEVSAPVGGPGPVTLTLDRPFLFVIHDVQTATPLFIGRVTDPTKA